MAGFEDRMGRRDAVAVMLATLAGGAIAATWPGAARAAGIGGAFVDLLGRASDSSLDKLAEPGAFYNDPDIRIGLPLVGGLGGGLGGVFGKVLDTGSKLGLTDNLVRRLNDAAGVAAGEAKPIFRSAISRLSLADVPGIATQNDGATQYLRRSAGDELRGKLRPLVDDGLAQVGAYGQLDSLTRRSNVLAKAGITHDKLGDSVTGQALDGIFRYIGNEETKLRANPLKPAGSLLKGILGGN
ncbi:DUF4197 domain-containing protein [Novosphingobium mangrovi (ex Huang et al. 2023)]|uniref:DUF4197 domain-containing protein n=1 Tax=Novosphingobium mangrovi (ex Huang et al. 2023) TaxID=2976432 RepID=A0ABT2I4E5_9SPHN|nr:DUF4197 domain-containing protein [Novosphingobium mangrovi (ex Huang et al. 2023)]MCT2399681.1 DUF4197 domain-containing protein [Novosphingobium mangrovi (ex Huang et al. 2023)]